MDSPSPQSKVLVVDDMAMFREPIAASLRHAGYATLVAKNGEEALVIARKERPDLILLDIAMPVMDGLTFLKRMRAEPALANTPIICLTAVCENDYLTAAAELGIEDYLLKSHFSLMELLDRVSSRIAKGPSAPIPRQKLPQVAFAGGIDPSSPQN